MFNWIKRLFGKENKPGYDISVNVIPSGTPRLKVKLENVPPSKPSSPPKIEQPPPKEIKRIYMNQQELSNLWLVVIDTTGMDKATRDYDENAGEGGREIDARKLGPLGIKTFAFVNAPDVNTAKTVMWRLLGARNRAARNFMREIARATRATNLSQILPILSRQGAVWNYVGAPNEALPGQQSMLARQKDLAGRDAYGNESAREYQPAAPQIPDGVETRVSSNDLAGASAEDRKVLNSGIKQQTPQMPNMPNMNPQQMMQMMQMMMAMMNGGQVPQMPVQEPPKASFTPQSQNINNLSQEDLAIIESNKTELAPEVADPDLQREIADIKARGGQSVDLNALDEEIDPAELARMAKMTESIVPKSPEQVAGKKAKRKPSDA